MTPAVPVPETVGRPVSPSPAPIPTGDDTAVAAEDGDGGEGTRAQTEAADGAHHPRLLTGGFVLPRPLQEVGNGDARGEGRGDGDGGREGAAAGTEEPIEPEEEELVNKDCPICFFEMSTGRKRPVFCSGSPSCGKCICNECFSEIFRRATPRHPALCPFCRRPLSTQRRYNEDLMGLLTASRPSMRQYTLPAHPSISFIRVAPTPRAEYDPRMPGRPWLAQGTGTGVPGHLPQPPPPVVTTQQADTDGSAAANARAQRRKRRNIFYGVLLGAAVVTFLVLSSTGTLNNDGISLRTR
uniref:RING-type domain-containing protein n=1 Tax=Chromera velia CCMP2878 TaxID=1169474 RepID=A0A0G4G9N9_9ALVE|eukprot:Cvel_20914.t1-p1 / transcript=Cvel_20914.t1 / gene=Cvel_20914 / organism=Chromera_velia_CCMP2878 / gene_product=hypothetical protein / transcript_product=hypothetical protein / location=Cvel_scaffold1919:5286-7583(-) / protein_length=296 / sequence_SO=supercontig / SO=protein_coding / is_pseudo=false